MNIAVLVKLNDIYDVNIMSPFRQYLVRIFAKRKPLIAMSKIWNICKETGSIGAWIAFAVAVFLLVGAALYPPPFFIDSSILVATSELLGFYILFRLPNMIASVKEGKRIKINKGDFNVEVEGGSNKEDEQ